MEHCFLRRCAALLSAACMMLSLLVGCAQPDANEPEVPEVPAVEPQEEPADTQPPVISGAHDLVTEVGVSVSYRSGVSVSDDVDERVTLTVDSSAVDLSTAGCYSVVYSATDSSGNTASVTVTITVKQPLPDEETEEEPGETSTQPSPAEDAKIVVTQEMLDGITSAILARILSPGMSKYEQARAIYNYVNQHITYVSTSDKTDWVRGAYLGLTRGKGDCYNYWAASKALLTAAGIDNLDLQRVGGATQHFWNLVNVGDGWYHFDTCWHPSGYPLDSFMLTEAEVRAYTQKLADEIGRVNYFTYDYDACPVYVEGTPVDEPEPTPEPSGEPGESPEPTDPTETTEPTEPVEGEPTEPVEPTDEQPAETSEPTEPVEGEPTEPTEPVDEQPTEPTEPTDEQPTEPTEPVDEPPIDSNTGDTVPTDPAEPEPAPADGGEAEEETEDGNAA